MSGSPFSRSARWLDRIQPSGTLVWAGSALALGLGSAVGVWLFKALIELVHQFFFVTLAGRLEGLGRWAVLPLPAVGGLIVGLLAYYLIGEERHAGVAGIIESTALAGGRLRYRRVPAKTAAAVLSIGSGASVGPEDPSVQIGANLGSMIGQVLHLSDERVRTLVAAGAAAGIASAFNAPIAGVFFALEIILGEIGSLSLGVILLVAVTASVFTQAVSGVQPAFQTPTYAFGSPWELPLYLVLGVAAGLVAIAYIRVLYLMHDFFHGLAVPRWVRPAIGGLAVGVVGVFLPQVFGVGYETIGTILQGQNLAMGLLLALLAAKLVLTPLSLGAGFFGGVFAPSLFLGATLGAAFGLAAERLFPGLGIIPAAFAMVGMAAVLAGAVHAPLTAILLLFEMTHDYRIILPLMFAVGVSLVISRVLHGDSVYTLGLARKGVRIERGRDLEVLDGLTVGEVMEVDYPTARMSEPIAAASDRLLRSRSHGLIVVDDAGNLAGVVTVQDIDRAQTDGQGEQTVGEVCTRQVLTAFPDESIGEALRRMSVRDVGRLPVVARDDPRHLLGVLRRTDMIRAYDVALARREAVRHRAQQVRLGAMGRVHVEEMRIEQGSPCAGVRVSDMAWPRECVIASVRRGSQLLIPRGDTVLQAGDVLAVVADAEALAAMQRLCSVSSIGS
ncbi:MAG: chloride channel protein [Caldilineales bacterium]|nr:chloride channel protein [Caldilineales bacterium]MCW5859224.1 chloride channel protein [Caldilineales bacterium]